MSLATRKSKSTRTTEFFDTENEYNPQETTMSEGEWYVRQRLAKDSLQSSDTEKTPTPKKKRGPKPSSVKFEKAMQIPLEDIHLDDRFQVRVKTNPNHVRAYKNRFLDFKVVAIDDEKIDYPFDLIHVWRREGKLVLIAGHHRFDAARAAEKNLFEMAFKVRGMLAKRHSVIEQRKRKTGVIDDHERGLLVQKIQGVIDVPKEKRLSAHLDDYIILQESFVEQGLFGIGQKDQIVVRIKRYKDWVESNGIVDIDVLLSVQHANDYFAHLIGRKKNKEIGAGHGNKLFGTFRNFVLHLAAENILLSVPAWTSRTGNRYRFKDDSKTPTSISLPILRRLYDSASDEMKLFILLALNCACGQGESGRLRKEECNPINGTITHARSKIKRFENAPTVTYRLWGRTKILLDRQLERQKEYPKLPEHATILILNDEGKPFWEDWEDANGKYHKKDRIAPMFDDLVKEIQKQDEHFSKQTFYKFRATSASAIYNKKEFNIFHGLRSCPEITFTSATIILV